MILFAIALGTAAAPPGALPPYEVSIRCAGLAEAEVRRREIQKLPTSREFDVAIFWGMAASESARKSRLPAARFTKDQEAATARASQDLGADSNGAAAELANCISQTPAAE